MTGLVAAKRYEQNRMHLPPEVQREMIRTNFTQIPKGDVVKTLLESEYLVLQSSIRVEASKRTSMQIANLREQMTEYNSLLDRLHEMTVSHEALEKTCEEKDGKILALEQEVEALKEDRRQGRRWLQQSSGDEGSIRRISFPTRQFQGIQFPVQQHMQQPIEQPMQHQQMGQYNCQIPVQQLLPITHQLPIQQMPSASINFPTVDNGDRAGILPYGQDGGRMKRAISNEYKSSLSVTGITAQSHINEPRVLNNKRIKTTDHSSPAR